MPELAGKVAEHQFRKTTIVGNSYVFFPGKAHLPKHVLNLHNFELEAARQRKKKRDDRIGMTAGQVVELDESENENGADSAAEE